ncbi:hypothetical protein PCANC_10670 [Puccinia coronata f. sp. avenae]|uniref:hAT-like transposase RNase-H fold domain-containing protein n=1 Tax=Puccinia coronata f. sp. avenae TaxID=200324 RepID=A0A2N5VG40_9BASI|nr:hypothetical protein PCANC_10670 [Puccinia coronata f. sp. avenae]
MKNIEHHLLASRKLPNDHISSIVEPMLTKFYKYWEEMKVFAAVVHVFDPRSKMSYVEFKLQGKAKSQEVAAVEIENLRTALYSWYKQYITDYKSKKQNQKSKNIDQNNDIICTGEVEDDNTQEFRQHLARTKGIGSTSAPTEEFCLALEEVGQVLTPSTHTRLAQGLHLHHGQFRMLLIGFLYAQPMLPIECAGGVELTSLRKPSFNVGSYVGEPPSRPTKTRELTDVER